jgi:hypothetical protein
MEELIWLPSTMTRRYVFGVFRDLLSEMDQEANVKEKYFLNVWAASMPMLRIAQGSSDTCETCFSLSLDMEQKLSHLLRAKSERMGYAKRVSDAIKSGLF